MLTPENIKQVNFKHPIDRRRYENVTLIYNVTQISNESVEKAIDFGLWQMDPRLIRITPEQLKYLHDKR